MMTNIQRLKYLTLFTTLLLLSGCAKHYTGVTDYDLYGFFSGLWHGIVFPFALIANIISWGLSIFDISIFNDIQFVGRPNTGPFFYYIGYFIGLCLWGTI